MTRPEAAHAMHTLDEQIVQMQEEARAAGVDPMSSDEYGELLVGWLSAAWHFYCRDDEAAA